MVDHPHYPICLLFFDHPLLAISLYTVNSLFLRKWKETCSCHWRRMGMVITLVMYIYTLIPQQDLYRIFLLLVEVIAIIMPYYPFDNLFFFYSSCLCMSMQFYIHRLKFLLISLKNIHCIFFSLLV